MTRPLNTLAAATILGLAVAGQPSLAMEFEAVSVPETDAEKQVVRTAPAVTIGGRRVPISYHTILRSGQTLGDATFGTVLDAGGRPIRAEDGSDRVSVDSEFSSLISVGERLFSVTQFASVPGAMYLTELAQDPASGMLTATSTRPVDLSDVDGVWSPSAGVVTPWNTHLGSEESPPDARRFHGASSLDTVHRDVLRMAASEGFDEPGATLADLHKAFSPYNHGFPVEVAVAADGSTQAAKRYAMGRVSVELAYVMPDRRTAYITDHGTNVGFYMFVADTPGDLGAGHLFAAIWRQTGAENGGTANLDWVPMGRATDDQIRPFVERRIRFDEIFDTAEMNTWGQCPEGFQGINTSDGGECLRLRPGMELAASRLETRRYAAMLGATTEFRELEGVTYDAGGRTLYVSVSEIGHGMEDGGEHDLGSLNDIRLPPNPCGAVYALPVGPDFLRDSDLVAQSMSAAVIGRPRSYPAGHQFERNTCDVDHIANPDNITFIPGADLLIIGEDSHEGHQNDAVWAWDTKRETLTRIQTTPYGAAATSTYWYPDINGHAYLMSVVRHPYGETDQGLRTEPSDAMPYVGYIGPFPALK